jgi:tripartite-type tricarboxylate transporter receptor subunit TctC
VTPSSSRLIVACLSLLISALAAGPATAQQTATDKYPNKPIHLIVGFAAGGGNDIIARIVGQKLQESLGQTVIVENRVGAGGRLSAEYVAAQPPDGYTLLVGASGAMAISPAVVAGVPYVTLRDFAPISMIASFPLIMVVNPDHPAKSVKDLVAWAKANPDKANYATSSTAFTLATELFKLRSGAPMVPIPYRSGNESVVSVMAGQSTVTIVDPPPTTPQVKAGKLRALAITAATRLDDLPDVPTMDEQGYPDVHVQLWSGLFAPAKTPPAAIKMLETELQRIMQLPDVQERFKAMATGTVGSSAPEFAKVIEAEIADVGRRRQGREPQVRAVSATTSLRHRGAPLRPVVLVI